MRLFLLSAFLFSVGAFGQEVPRRCSAGQSVFPIQAGDYLECSLGAGERHEWQFDPAAGESYGFHLIRVSGNGVPCAEVRPEYNPFLLSRLCAVSLSVPNARPSIPISNPVRHALLITSNAPVVYRLNFERLYPPTAQATLLEPGRQVRAAINPVGDRDMYRFSVEAGDRYGFDLVRLSGSGLPVMAEVSPFTTSVTTASGSRRVASADGVFGLRVYEPQDDDTFEYGLVFVCEGRCGRDGLRTQAIVNAAHPRAAVCSGAFATIYGKDFSTVTRTWESRDFRGDALPTLLDGFGATMDNVPAPVYFVSPTQMNIIVPDSDLGLRSLRILSAGQTFAPIPVWSSAFCPAAFQFAGQRYAIAVHADGTLVSTPTVPGRSARPGDTISLYATGLGETLPAYRPGILNSAPLPTRSPVRVRLSDTQAEVSYAGLISPGLYQINVRIPQVPAGAASLRIEVGSGRSPEDVFLEIGAP